MHTVESIVMSVISMLSGPNLESPANVDAAVCAVIGSSNCSLGSLFETETVSRGSSGVPKKGITPC